VSTLELDYPFGEALATRFPGLKSAVDPDGMAALLQKALVGDDRTYVIEACTPGKAYVDVDECLIRYSLRLRDTGTGRQRTAVVTGRLFIDSEASTAFFQERLEPLAGAQGRDEVALFRCSIARLDSVQAVVYAFPIDPDLPSLVDATDPARMTPVLGRLVRASLAPDLDVQDCEIAVAHYPRRHRCVIRYTVRGRSRDRESSLVTFGKISDSAEPPTDGSVVDSLRREMAGIQPHVQIPRVVGSVPELGLVLIEGIPGRPEITPLLKARVGGARRDGDSLDRAVETAGAVAARVHGCSAHPGITRSVGREIAGLRDELRFLERLDSVAAGHLSRRFSRIIESATGTDRFVFSHGDFTPSQILFGESQVGLIDFDNLCEAEPEMDLGQFSAYLGAAVVKAAPGGEGDLGGELRQRFLESYAKTAQVSMANGLGSRLRIYERLSLVRMAVRAWRQLKPARAGVALRALERFEDNAGMVDRELDERRFL
jgi:phosphotransferase family enzyme